MKEWTRQSVRQGSVLGHWLYMLYVHDLAEELKKSHHGCQIGRVPCSSLVHPGSYRFLTLHGVEERVARGRGDQS